MDACVLGGSWVAPTWVLQKEYGEVYPYQAESPLITLWPFLECPEN
jgi:hypothetical protein